ncbi:MAG TPA: IPT/TIG domain-containing protein [Actinocrinis sp.]|nr:IPT/TIG domain-containing protein [Actinocrinis sp.]
MPISPNQGSTGGGTVVTITGVNLANTTAVTFGTRPAVITSNTPTSVTVISPAGAGAVSVRVTTAGGTSNPLNFYYIGAPFTSSLSADSGPTAGGETVTLSGIGLSTASSVTFGSNDAVPTILSDGLLSVVVPAGSGAGSVSVTVTTAGGSCNGLSYTYVDSPTIVAVSPSSGSSSGGTSVTVSGSGLSTVSGVTIGGSPAPFGVINDGALAVITPPGSVGSADIVVTTTGGSATAVGAFTYVSGPGI